MPVTKKYLLILKYFLLTSIFIGIYYSYNNHLISMVILLLLNATLMVNEYIRYNKLTINSKYMYDTSLLFTIFGIMVLNYFIHNAGTNTCIFFPLIELLRLKGLKLKFLFSVHSLLFLIVSILNIGILNNWYKFATLGLDIFTYLAVVIIAYSVKTIRIEKEEISYLNEKLQLANINLQQYSLEVEELTTYRERTMMAQELHDSLGHSLMALSMHLEYAKKYVM